MLTPRRLWPDRFGFSPALHRRLARDARRLLILSGCWAAILLASVVRMIFEGVTSGSLLASGLTVALVVAGLCVASLVGRAAREPPTTDPTRRTGGVTGAPR